MPHLPHGALWHVVGGEDKGGIIVKRGEELSSEKLPARLATGSLVHQLGQVGERLHYELVRGTGPPSGWISLRLNYKELVVQIPKDMYIADAGVCPQPRYDGLARRAKADADDKAAPVVEPVVEDRVWEVVGGEDTGGIIVKLGKDLFSDKLGSRLSKGSFVRELQLVEERLEYELVRGAGPRRGWVSIRLMHKELLVRSQRQAQQCGARPEEAPMQAAQATPCAAFAQPDPRLEEMGKRAAQAEEARKRAAQAQAFAERDARLEDMSKRAALAQKREMEDALREKQALQCRVREALKREAEQRSKEEAELNAMALAKQRACNKAKLDRLEIHFVLKAWLAGEYANKQVLLENLARKGIKDLATLKRGLIKRIRQEDEEQGRPQKHPLPLTDKGLLAIADRILELDELRELVNAQYQTESEQREIIKELLEHGVGSVAGLKQSWLHLQSDLLSETMLGELLKDAARRSVEGQRSCEVASFGKAPFLATAPHDIFLLRDGHSYHALENNTSWIAQQLARELDGCALCWHPRVQWRTVVRHALGVSRSKDGQANAIEESLDPVNRDPNYLRKDELDTSLWFSTMSDWAAQHRETRTAPRYRRAGLLHVDVHGCQDPPNHPTHVILGLGAMRRRVEESDIEEKTKELHMKFLKAFADGLLAMMTDILAPLLICPLETVASVRGLTAAHSESGEPLSGAWPAETGRLTQTQQSVSHLGVTHAIQIEMSLTLRRALMKDPRTLAKLARALDETWHFSLLHHRLDT